MKIRLLLTLAGLAISFALPTFAQQKEAVDPKIVEQFFAGGKKYAEAVNNNDAAAVAALYTEDAVFLTPQGPIYGRKAIEKFFADDFQKWHHSNFIVNADQYSPHIIGTSGNEAWSNGKWSQTIKGQNFGPIQLNGYWSSITVREGDAWKILMDTTNVTPAPPATGTATPSPTTTPTSQ